MNILDLEGHNIMNILARSVLEMYTFDPNPDDTSRDNLMRQSIELIARFPTIIAYAYNILRHSQQGRSFAHQTSERKSFYRGKFSVYVERSSIYPIGSTYSRFGTNASRRSWRRE